MAMNPFDNAKVMSDLWGRGTQSFLDAQRSLFNTMAQGEVAGTPFGMPQAPMPDVQSFQAASTAFQQALVNAQSVSETFAKAMRAEDGTTPDPVAAQIMAKIFDPRGWLSATSEVDEALNRMAEGPRLADLWSVERKFASLMTAWLALRKRNLEHNTVMLEAWSKAAGLFAKAVNERAEQGVPLESARALMALWVEIANDTLLETQRTEAFLKSQRDTLKASTDLRLAQQDVGEFYSHMFGYPSRAELDDVHKSLTELRRETRALKREARAQATANPAAPPPEPSAPKASTSPRRAAGATKSAGTAKAAKAPKAARSTGRKGGRGS